MPNVGDFSTIALLGAGVAAMYVLVRWFFGTPAPPYEKRTSLMSQGEQEFYHVLHGVVEGKWSVFAMVRMADLLKVKPNIPKPHFWMNRIKAKHVDFLLCDSENLEPLLAIEFEDAGRQRADRQDRDFFIHDALASAGLPILRVKPQPKYNSSELRKTIYDALGLEKRIKT